MIGQMFACLMALVLCLVLVAFSFQTECLAEAKLMRLGALLLVMAVRYDLNRNDVVRVEKNERS
jgi:hypothetical protein